MDEEMRGWRELRIAYRNQKVGKNLFGSFKLDDFIIEVIYEN